MDKVPVDMNLVNENRSVEKITWPNWVRWAVEVIKIVQQNSHTKVNWVPRFIVHSPVHE